MLTVHIHQARGSRLGEVEIQPATEAPRKPPVPSGAAIAARRIRRPVLLLALPAIRPALLSVRVRAETDEPVPSAMRAGDRKSTRLNSSHVAISYAVFCLKKKSEVCPAHWRYSHK